MLRCIVPSGMFHCLQSDTPCFHRDEIRCCHLPTQQPSSLKCLMCPPEWYDPLFNKMSVIFVIGSEEVICWLGCLYKYSRFVRTLLFK